MIESITLGKRAENYVWFAKWCRDHQMSPTLTAECIELCIRHQRRVKWDKRGHMITQIAERLHHCGAVDISFEDGWPQFESPIGERTKLPIKEFI